MCIPGAVLDGCGDMMSSEFCFEEAMDAVVVLQECWSFFLVRENIVSLWMLQREGLCLALIP